MADKVIVSEWIKKAEDDLRFAEANLREGSEFYAQICFHFQQAAEKYLKAFILDKGLEFGRVHDLVHLLRTCIAHDPTLDELKEDCVLLNTAYIETRYPVHWPTNYTKQTAEQAQASAIRIARRITEQLGL